MSQEKVRGHQQLNMFESAPFSRTILTLSHTLKLKSSNVTQLPSLKYSKVRCSDHYRIAFEVSKDKADQNLLQHTLSVVHSANST